MSSNCLETFLGLFKDVVETIQELFRDLSRNILRHLTKQNILLAEAFSITLHDLRTVREVLQNS